MASFTSAQDFFVSRGQSKKFELIQKSHVPGPFVSRAKALPAKRREKGYGDENERKPARASRSRTQLSFLLGSC